MPVIRLGSIVDYALAEGIATVAMDDGKVNVMSLDMVAALNDALDRALADRAVVVIAGRERVFSAGFDLAVIAGGGAPAVDMIRGAFELVERILSFPFPVIAECPGHAVAMGLFLLLAADYRLGAAGDHKLVANEVAIGLTMPRAAVEIMRLRLTPAAFDRAVVLAQPFTPEGAVAAGILDRVVSEERLRAATTAVAAELREFDVRAHAATKLRVRAQALTALRSALDADLADLRAALG